MRLLNATSLKLEEFFESKAPKYAILSHTWTDDEVSYQDIQDPRPQPTHKLRYTKILYCCNQALKDGLGYAWVDTCCIDKTSSSELSEAINSMFRWYEQAEICYAYLADVSANDDPMDHGSSFAESRWFTRGWTLQELLAPPNLEFFSTDWNRIGSRSELLDVVSRVCGVDPIFLETDRRLEGGRRLQQASIAERLSWVSRRETTRTEDMAYCLLGIFGISMALIYGEGRMAFIRLQEEIMKHSDDQTLLAWTFAGQKLSRLSLSQPSIFHPVLAWWALHKTPTKALHNEDLEGHSNLQSGFFAETPASFTYGGDFVPCDVGEQGSEFSVTNKGLRITLPISRGPSPYALLQCRAKNDPTTMLAVPLVPLQGNRYARGKQNLGFVAHDTWSKWQKREIYLSTQSELPHIQD
jgi:hypothetical protein